MNIAIQLVLGFVISALIGALAYLRQSLTAGGVAGAVIVGTLTFGLGGLSWALVIVAFFVSSSLLTHYRSALKRRGSRCSSAASRCWADLSRGFIRTCSRARWCGCRRQR